MLRKLTYALTVLSVMFGMLGFAAPAYALGDSSVRLLKGTIVAVSTKTHTLTVARPNKTSVKVIVAKGTRLMRNGKAVTLAKLRVGDKTSLKYNPATKRADEVDDTPGLYDIHGTVQTVDTTASAVTIASEEGGNSVTLNVNTGTVILRNGAPAALADLLVGDKVEAKYDSATMIASLIKTDSEDGEVQGTLSTVDGAAGKVSITPAGGGSDVVLSVVNSTVLISNDTIITLADLHVGDAVQAEFDSTSLVASKIEVGDSSSGHNH